MISAFEKNLLEEVVNVQKFTSYILLLEELYDYISQKVNDVRLFQQMGGFKNIHGVRVESLKRWSAISVLIHLISKEIYEHHL